MPSTMSSPLASWRYDPNQPRHPAGSSQGGRWAPKAGPVDVGGFDPTEPPDGWKVHSQLPRGTVFVRPRPDNIIGHKVSDDTPYPMDDLGIYAPDGTLLTVTHHRGANRNHTISQQEQQRMLMGLLDAYEVAPFDPPDGSNPEVVIVHDLKPIVGTRLAEAVQGTVAFVENPHTSSRTFFNRGQIVVLADHGIFWNGYPAHNGYFGPGYRAGLGSKYLIAHEYGHLRQMSVDSTDRLIPLIVGLGRPDGDGPIVGEGMRAPHFSTYAATNSLEYGAEVFASWAMQAASSRSGTPPRIFQYEPRHQQVIDAFVAEFGWGDEDLRDEQLAAAAGFTVTDLEGVQFIGDSLNGPIYVTADGDVFAPPIIVEGDALTAHGGTSHDQSTHGNWADGAVEDDYRGTHRPNEDGPRAHDLLETDVAPPDVYDNPHYYTGYERQALNETMLQLRRARGNPDATLRIYRAAPKGLTDPIRDGDWVTLSRAYAEQHSYGMSETDDMEVYSIDVPAAAVRWAMDDLMEWGYFPDLKDRLIEFDSIVSHASHDQSTHGNWADGGRNLGPKHLNDDPTRFKPPKDWTVMGDVEDSMVAFAETLTAERSDGVRFQFEGSFEDGTSNPYVQVEFSIWGPATPELGATDGDWEPVKIGDATRRVMFSNGRMDAESLMIEDDWQGHGVGTQFQEGFEDLAAAAGIHTVYVSAAAVGRYAWARAGYDWAFAEGPEVAARRARSMASTPEQEAVAERLTAGADAWHQASDTMFAEVDIPDGVDVPTPYEVIEAFGPTEGAQVLGNWSGMKRLRTAVTASAGSSRDVLLDALWAAWDEWWPRYPIAAEGGYEEGAEDAWRLLAEGLVAHASHDQSTHGNWARGAALAEMVSRFALTDVLDAGQVKELKRILKRTTLRLDNGPPDYELTEDGEILAELKQQTLADWGRDAGWSSYDVDDALTTLDGALGAWTLRGGWSEQRQAMHDAVDRLRAGNEPENSMERAMLLQKAWAEQTLALRNPNTTEYPLSRIVSGPHGALLAAAATEGIDFEFEAHTLSSWAEPRATNAIIRKWIGNDRHVVELQTTATRDEVWAHVWSEPLLRTSELKAPGEWIVDDRRELTASNVSVREVTPTARRLDSYDRLPMQKAILQSAIRAGVDPDAALAPLLVAATVDYSHDDVRNWVGTRPFAQMFPDQRWDIRDADTGWRTYRPTNPDPDPWIEAGRQFQERGISGYAVAEYLDAARNYDQASRPWFWAEPSADQVEQRRAWVARSRDRLVSVASAVGLDPDQVLDEFRREYPDEWGVMG